MKMKMESATKDYLFALLLIGTEVEKDKALRELCNRYNDIGYCTIKRLAEQHK